MERILLNTQCIPYRCGLNCCKNEFQCASKPEECRELEVGATCFESYECKSSCCVEKTCQGESECKLKELGMLSFFAVFILSSIIILIVGLYFHSKQKKRRNLLRRASRVPRIREIIAEGEILDDEKPPIHTIAVGETMAELSDFKAECQAQKPYLKKLEPAKTIPDDFDRVIWRSRANSRSFQPMMAPQPQELSNFDPFALTRSSRPKMSIDEGKEIHPELLKNDGGAIRVTDMGLENEYHY